MLGASPLSAAPLAAFGGFEGVKFFDAISYALAGQAATPEISAGINHFSVSVALQTPEVDLTSIFQNATFATAAGIDVLPTEIAEPADQGGFTTSGQDNNFSFGAFINSMNLNVSGSSLAFRGFASPYLDPVEYAEQTVGAEAWAAASVDDATYEEQTDAAEPTYSDQSGSSGAWTDA